MLQTHLAFSAALVLGSVAFAQEPAESPALGYEDTYQINYVANINLADSAINITNAGFHLENSLSTGSGYICANVYVFDPTETMIACCSCPVSRNGLKSLSVQADLISNASSVPTSIVVKLVATTPINGTSSATSCNASSIGQITDLALAVPQPTAPKKNAWASGMRAWATHVHSSQSGAAITEDKFSSVPLSQNEAAVLNSGCAQNQANGNICKACRFGAL